jgi:hypothetical protein
MLKSEITRRSAFVKKQPVQGIKIEADEMLPNTEEDLKTLKPIPISVT